MNVSWGQQYQYDQLVRVITSGDCTRVVSPTCSLSQLSQLSQPLHHQRSLEHFGHISATFPTVFPFFCSVEQRKCISRCHRVPSSICESFRETSSSTTFQQAIASASRAPSIDVLQVRQDQRERTATAPSSVKQQVSTKAVSSSGERQVLTLLSRHQA